MKKEPSTTNGTKTTPAGEINNLNDLLRQKIERIMGKKRKADIGANVLGESTLVTVKGRDFRAESVERNRREVLITGYFDNGTQTITVKPSEIDLCAWDELEHSLKSAITIQNKKENP